jgi:hypothetical protein
LAYASFTVAGGAVTFNSQSGDFDETPGTPIYTNVGDYLLTLSSAIDPAESCYQVTCRTTAGRVCVPSIIAASTTDTAIRIEVNDETAANVDPLGFDLTIVVKPAN